MTILNDEVIKDFELARKVLTASDYSVVVISNRKILNQKKGNAITSMLEVIDEIGNTLNESVIGVRLLGKATSLLCRYEKVKGVYSPKGTKTGIALLIMGGVPCQVDELIPITDNQDYDEICLYENMLKDVISPEEAYKILKENVLENQIKN